MSGRVPCMAPRLPFVPLPFGNLAFFVFVISFSNVFHLIFVHVVRSPIKSTKQNKPATPLLREKGWKNTIWNWEIILQLSEMITIPIFSMPSNLSCLWFESLTDLFCQSSLDYEVIPHKPLIVFLTFSAESCFDRCRTTKNIAILK